MVGVLRRFVSQNPLLIVVGLGLAIAGGIYAFNTLYYRDPCPDDDFRVPSTLARNWRNTDFCRYAYPSSEFQSGGVERDGIPPLYPRGYRYPDDIPRYGGDEAAFTVSYQSVEEAERWLQDQSPVLVVEIGGDARAYALGILTRHEIANTEIGSVPVAVTFCPLCNTGIAFERVIDGRELHFGVTGYLRNSDLVMWDHETESWWQQATGEAVVGEMTGSRLNFVTSSMVSWREFKAAFPNGLVLKPPSESSADSNPYTAYDSGDPFLFYGEWDRRLPSTERVLGYALVSETTTLAVAYDFPSLRRMVVVNDEVGGNLVAVFWQPGATSALDRRAISESREVGSATLFSRELEDGTLLTFNAEGTTIKDDQTSSTWNIFGQATGGALKGTQLRQLIAVTHFWFAWQAFYPTTIVWEAGKLTDEVLKEPN